MRRLLILIMFAGSVLAACQSAAAPTPTNPPPAAKPAASPAASGQAAAAASPAASPVVGTSPSPSPSPAAGAASGGQRGAWATIQSVLTGDLLLLTIGIVLSVLAVIAWSLSNRAEATPNEDQVAEMHRFVTDHFAKYVARGLAAEGVGPVAVSKDPAWRNVYLQHLRLHNELHPFVPPRRSWWGPVVAFVCAGPVGMAALWIIRRGVTPRIALQIFEADIDEAVRRELAVLSMAGQRANPAVSS